MTSVSQFISNLQINGILPTVDIVEHQSQVAAYGQRHDVIIL